MIQRLIVVMMTVVLCAGAAASGQVTYETAWAAQIGTKQLEVCHSLAVDRWGNVYLGGRTEGDLAAPKNGPVDAYVSKFDSAGNEVWTRQFGSSGTENVASVAVDGAGNVYVTGTTNGALAGTYVGWQDMFVIKFDPAGNEIWSTQAGTGNDEIGVSIAVDTAGNTYVGGTTNGNFGAPYGGSGDSFISKFDSNGDMVWTKQLNGPSNDTIAAITVDAAGNVYASGYTHTDLAGPHAGRDDAFVIKFDSDGNEIWGAQIGTGENDRSNSVAVDDAGNVFITGETRGDLGRTNVSSDEAFTAKFDPLGDIVWIRQIGAGSFTFGYDVVTDSGGNVYMSGMTEGDLFGLVGNKDAFVIKYDSAGNEVWSDQFGTPQSDSGNAVALGPSGALYVSGNTSGFLGDFSGGTLNLDAYVVKYDRIPEPVTLSLLSVGGLALLRKRNK